MTGRERILATVAGEKVDRIPVAPFVYSNVVREWKQDPATDVVSGTAEFYRHFGMDIIHRNFNIRHNDLVSAPNWRVSQSSRTEGSEIRVTREIETPAGVLREVESLTALSPYMTVSAQIECFIKDAEDFEIFRKYAPEPVPADFGDLRRAKAAVGEDGVTAPWISGVFNYMARLRSLEELITDPYMEPDFYEMLAEFSLERLKKAMEPVAGEGVDFVSLAGNLANGTMAGPRYYEEYVLPYESRLIRRLQRDGIKVIYHNCGDAANMIACYNRLMPDCYESMTEPPYADNSLEKCLEAFDKRIALMGNVDQIRFLRQASPEEVYAHARHILEMAGKRGRFILGTSDLLEENTPAENLFALVRAARDAAC